MVAGDSYNMHNDNKVLLMSIKSIYANQIFNGTKKYEFRRKSLGESNLDKKIYIYSSQKDKAIVGYFFVSRILKGNIDYLLNITGYNNGDDRKSLVDYFQDCPECHALEISNPIRLKRPILLSKLKRLIPHINIPQYYRYIKDNDSLYDILNYNETSE